MATPIKPIFSTDSLLAGSVGIYSAPVGTPMPAFPAQGSLVVVSSVWQGFGFTDSGVKSSYAPTYKAITADESMSTIINLKTGENLKLSFALKEGTLENMKRAISGATLSTVAAGAGQPELVTLDLGGSQQYDELSLLLVGRSPYSGFPRMVQVYRTIPTANVEQTYKKDDVVMVPVELEAMTYSANPVGKQLLQIVEKRSNATS